MTNAGDNLIDFLADKVASKIGMTNLFSSANTERIMDAVKAKAVIPPMHEDVIAEFEEALNDNVMMQFITVEKIFSVVETLSRSSGQNYKFSARIIKLMEEIGELSVEYGKLIGNKKKGTADTDTQLAANIIDEGIDVLLVLMSFLFDIAQRDGRIDGTAKFFEFFKRRVVTKICKWNDVYVAPKAEK